MVKPVLYGMDLSPPVRSCLLTLKALDIPFEYKEVNLMAGEHLTEEFLKHNPQHTVPVLDDNGTWMWDSHAINAYLVDKYGKDDDSLYPRDLAKRAVVNQRLFFDASILFMSLRNVSMPMFCNNVTVVPKEKTDNILEGYGMVETFLGDNRYITGDSITIADFCIVCTVTSTCAVVDLEPARFPKTVEWISRLEKLNYYNECNTVGCKKYIDILKSTLTEINI